MDQETQKLIAQHLRKPEGEMGLEVAQHMNKGNAGMNRFAIQNLSLQTGDTILEIGMGNGFFAAEILEQASEGSYTGFDYSETMVEAATKLNARWVEQDRMQFLKGKASNLPFEDESFDKILAVNTIYFWENPEKELSEISRVLHPEGVFVLAIRPEKSMADMPFTQYGFHLRKDDEVENLLEQAGFRLLEKEQFSEKSKSLDGSPIQLHALAFICKHQR